MKRQLASIKTLRSDQAFFFPYMLFIITLVLIIVLSSIPLYQNHIEMTTFTEEQLKLETLIQMAYTQVRKEQPYLLHNDRSGEISYNYPYGIVYVSYFPKDIGWIIVNFQALTDNGARETTSIPLRFILSD
ncbi:hypothetical protein [Radiobacillus sp. PE A8.2]|uniref:hypothetical protein n=1 Tax=Radiobacillus sp. PE A8.2 TaxID=3380349 RepID=UPI0038901565